MKIAELNGAPILRVSSYSYHPDLNFSGKDYQPKTDCDWNDGNFEKHQWHLCDRVGFKLSSDQSG